MNSNNKNQYLSVNNENRIKSYVMTELSKKYNIHPMVKTIDNKIKQIMEHICQTVSIPKNLSSTDGLQYLNKLTIEHSINGFSDILKPYNLKNASNNLENNDVNSEYEKLMKERDYTVSNLENSNRSIVKTITEMSDTDNSLYDELLGNYNNINSNLDSKLTSIPEVLDYSERKESFNARLIDMKMNRNKIMEDRNLIDFEKNKKNYEEQIGIYKNVDNISNIKSTNNLELNTIQNNSLNDVSNIGTDLIDKNVLLNQRYDEYKKDINYNSHERQFIVNSKDRLWYGSVENNIIMPGLEQYRYRFGINNNKTSGIYLQNRQKNVSAIRITTVYISINELDSLDTGYTPPYIYVYIPELENRIETSNINRKFIFAVLTLDDNRLNGQLKYVNFLSANYYITNPIADLSNMTIEILNPLGNIYSDSKDNLKIKGMTVDNPADPKFIILTLDKFVKRTQYNKGDIVIIKNYGINLSNSFTIFMNREQGHFLKTNPSTDEFIDKLYIDVPKEANTNGLYTIQAFFQDIITMIRNNINPYANTEGVIINTTLQPVVIFEISKIEPKSKGLSKENVTLI